MSIIYALLGPLFIQIMTTSDEVRLVSETFLIFIVIGPIFGALPFFNGWHICWCDKVS